MIEKNEICVFKVVNEAVTAAAVFNKNSSNHQSKNSNDFMIVLLNNLQKHSYTFQV